MSLVTDEVYIGIDLGGTRIRAARFSSDLVMQQRSETLTLDEEGLDAVIGRMAEQARAVWPTGGARVGGIGVSAPGPIDPIAGVITAPPNLKGWHNVPLRKLLEEQLGVRVYLGNDANLAALAETAMGAARGYRHVVFLTISTGIGAGIVSDGKLLIGSQGLGAECGHLIIVADNDQVSTLEKEASGPSIARKAQMAIEKGEMTSMLQLVSGDLESITAATVGMAAKGGDKLALKIIHRAGNMIGLGIVSLLHTFNPQIVVIGGGVAEGTWDLLYKPMREAIEKYSIDSAYWEKLVIAQAMLGENVSLIGAGALALRKGG